VFRDGLRIDEVDARTSGAWANGDVLKFDGTGIVAGSAGAAHGVAVLDFGATFTDTASVTITGQSWVTSGSDIDAWMVADESTADNTSAEHEALAASSAFVVTTRVPGVGFTINAYSDDAFAQGTFRIYWMGTAGNVLTVDGASITVDGELVTVS
jgi:hypothetical protein